MGHIVNRLYEKDIKWIFFFNTRLKCGFFDKTFPKLTYLGGATVAILTCVALICVQNSLLRNIGTEALIALFVSHVVVQILKRSIRRQRPKDAFSTLNKFTIPLDCYSFPSGHTTAIFSLATTLTLGKPFLGLILFPIAFIVGISRLYLGVHYPSDVIAGISIATVTSTILHLYML